MISLVEFCILASLGTLTAAGASHGYNQLRQPRSGRRAAAASMTCQDEDSGRPSSGAWHEPRREVRHRIRCRIEYIQGDVRSVGTLIDISDRGWRAIGRRSVGRGTVLSLNIFLPEQPIPIMIDNAVVRWTNGPEFGLELTHIKPESASRLSDYLSMHLEERSRPVSDLSPFSYN